MARPPLYEWYGKQYESGEKSTDWYWALGIIAVGAFVACIIFGNILLAILVVAAAGAVGIQATRRSPEHRFRLTKQGLEIDDKLFHYDTMLHFSVLEYMEKDIPPALSIKTRSVFTPHLLVPLTTVDPDEIYDFVSMHVAEGRHDQSVMDRLVDTFQI